MKHLYYCRHGQSAANAAHIWGGHTDSALTEEGEQQATTAGLALTSEGTRIDLIICSPLQRAHNTARRIAAEIGYPVNNIVVDDQFIERSFGDMDGKPNTVTFLAAHPYSDTDKFPNVETVENLQKRAAAGLEYLKTLDADNILLVGHGAFGRALVRVIDGRPYTDEFKLTNITRVIPNATVIKLI